MLPVSIFEWGICLLTIYFCWWKYGWNVDFLKTVRQFFRKIENLVPLSSDNGEKDSSELKHFNKIPTSGTKFNPRSNKNDAWDSADPFFFRSLESPEDEWESEASRNDHPCFVCTHPNKAAVFDEIKESVPLKNCLDCDGLDNPQNPWYIRKFSHIIFFWRKWFIGQQYHFVSLKDMMSDVMLNQSVEEAAKQEFEEKTNTLSLAELIKKHKRRCEAIVIRMRAKQPAHPWFALYVRVASWIIGKCLARIYPKILVRASQMEMLQKCRRSGFPILYLPVHRSHIDYVLISWVLVANDMRAPVVAAGENLNIPVFSLMMKSVGGFFIKRKLEDKNGKKDVVYRTMLQSYMRRCLVDDNDMEFFVEGGRTRTGKPGLPKGGLLSIVVDTLIKKHVEDILVVPVNFSYDRLLEGNYIREQLGQPKVNESFASAALGLWNSLQAKYGNARVDFGHPFSMREFVQSYRAQNVLAPYPSPSNSDCGFEVGDDNKATTLSEMSSSSTSSTKEPATVDQRDIVDALAKHAIYEGIQCFTLMSTNAIAFLLLNKYRRGVPLEILKKEVLGLKKEMFDRGHDSGFSDNLTEVLEHGIKTLGPTLVRKELQESTQMLRPVSSLPNVIELSYYSNCVLPIYAMEAVVATSSFILSGGSFDGKTEIVLSEKELINVCSQFCEVLHFEFLFCPPCQTLETSIESTIAFMKRQNIFMELKSSSKAPCQGKHIVINVTQKRERLKFLKTLLEPIMDSYIAASSVLKRLVGNEVEEKRLQMDMLAEIKGQILNNNLPYGESMALDPIRNFIQLALRWQVLESYKKGSLAVYFLHRDFNLHEKLDIVVQRLRKFRV